MPRINIDQVTDDQVTVVAELLDTYGYGFPKDVDTNQAARDRALASLLTLGWPERQARIAIERAAYRVIRTFLTES